MSSALSKRGSTTRWRKLRRWVLERDGYRCRYCGRRATTVDHVLPRSAFQKQGMNADFEENLVAACKDCNFKKGEKGPDFLENRSAGQPAPVFLSPRFSETNRKPSNLSLDDPGPLGRSVSR